MSISLNMQGVYRNNKKMSIGAHNDKGSRFNKSDYDHIYDMYKLHMNNFTLSKNNLAWFAFETIAQEIYQEMEYVTEF